MGQEENDFYQQNVTYSLRLRSQYQKNFIRTISNMAFKWSCVDVNYSATENYQKTHGMYIVL